MTPEDHDARTLILACAAAYLATGFAMAATLLPVLPEVLESAPVHLLLLAHALRATLLAVVFLPPATPAIVAVALVLVGRSHGRVGVMTPWLAWGTVPLVVERIAQTARVVAGAGTIPRSVSAWLARPTDFVVGPTPFLRALGLHVGPGVAYWCDRWTVPTVIALHCWSRGLAELYAALRGAGYDSDGQDRRAARCHVVGLYLVVAWCVWRAAPRVMLGFLQIVA
jgi:hypothetical protein